MVTLNEAEITLFPFVKINQGMHFIEKGNFYGTAVCFCLKQVFFRELKNTL
jgi:hypothetical protein